LKDSLEIMLIKFTVEAHVY